MIAADTTIERALAWATAQLAASPHVDAAMSEARGLLAHVLQVSPARVHALDAQSLADSARAQFARLIARRAAGEPAAYLTGNREFWSLTLHVTPDVLVPRPETELLVERALSHGGSAAALEVADLGTGSGCVALAIASERPHWHVTATDASSAALDVAIANAGRLALTNLTFRHGNWCEALDRQRYALLVSNPPYIAEAEAALLDPALRHEPRAALTPGTDGLSALRLIASQAPQRLLADGWLLLEHGATQAAAVRAMLVAQGFTHVISQRDLAGIERVTEGCWRSN